MILFVEIPRILFPIVVIPVVNTSPSELTVTPDPTRSDPVVVDPDTLTFCRNVAFVFVRMFSVFPTPVNPVPLPTNEVAVTTPTTLIPDSLVVTADPTNVCSNVALVAARSPVLELNVRFVPVLGGKFPVGAVANNTLHVVSDDSSVRARFDDVVAVSALPVTSPTNVVAVTTPV